MVQLLGAVHLLMATITWLLAPISWLLPWFVGFLVLTITAERVELARLHMPRSVEHVLVGATCAFTIAVIATMWWPHLGIRISGTILLIFTIWLVFHDVAR